MTSILKNKYFYVGFLPGLLGAAFTLLLAGPFFGDTLMTNLGYIIFFIAINLSVITICLFAMTWSNGKACGDFDKIKAAAAGGFIGAVLLLSQNFYGASLSFQLDRAKRTLACGERIIGQSASAKEKLNSIRSFEMAAEHETFITDVSGSVCDKNLFDDFMAVSKTVGQGNEFVRTNGLIRNEDRILLSITSRETALTRTNAISVDNLMTRINHAFRNF